MLKLNATLHETSVLGEQQGLESKVEQHKQSLLVSRTKEKQSSSFAVHFKAMTHTLYVWMD
jgi:hypothetical protein